MAAEQSEVNFLTALVSDFNEHKTEYVSFIKTATGYPADLTHLAIEIRTYTDDSYTTLLDGDNINVESLMSYATNLPWYSRVAAAAGISAASGSASTTSSGSTSTSLGSGANKYIAPAGALLGGAALLLL
ncbi:CIC11C00000003946 [Sungouiella intermedia]|nr:CIC11C00000003946 [[Candida] intermedia]